MWSFIKIPKVPGESEEGFVSLEQYLVSEGDIVDVGEAIAIAHANSVSFRICANYRGRILKIILGENTFVGIRDPIATLELHDDPVDGKLIEYFEKID